MGTTEVDVIRTIFEAQFTGRQTVRAVVQELDLARQATDALSKALAGSSGSGKLASSTKEAAANLSLFQKGLDANAWKRYTEAVKGHVAAVDEGAISLEKAKASLDKWAWALGNSASVSEEMKKQLLNQIDVIRNQGEAYDNVGQQIGKAVAGLDLVPPALKAVGVAAGLATAGIVAAGAALVALYPVAREGANMAQLASSFEMLNRNVMGTPYLLRDMTEAADGTITRLSTMEGFLTLTAGASESATRRFAQAAPELMEIAKAANKLNPTLGDTNFMFNSLARGVKRSEVRLLDNLGLNIKVAEANKTYAEQIGKTVLQLTAEDKQMALLNETLRVGRNLIDQVGDSTEALPDRFNRMTSAWANFVNAWKMGVSAAYPGGEGPANFLDEQARRMEIIAKLTFARQQGIDVGYVSNRYSDANTTLEELERYNRALDKELKRREEIEARYRESRAGEARRRNEEAMQDPYLQWLIQQGEAVVTQQEIIENQRQIWRRDYERYMAQLGTGYDTGRDNVRQTEAQKAAAEELARVHKEQAAILEDYWGRVTDVQQKSLEANAAAMARYFEDIAATGSVMRDLSGENSLFTTSLDNIGSAWVTAGGRTEEQNKILEELKDAYEDTNDELRDYRIGLRGYGEDSEKVGEKMAKLAGEADFLKGKMDDLNAIVGESSQVNVAAIFDIDKVAERLRNLAADAGIGAVGWAALMTAQGEWSDVQAEAALKQVYADRVMQQAVQKIALNPDISKEDAQAFWDDVWAKVQDVENMDFSAVLNLKLEPQIDFGGIMKEAGYDSSAYIPREERDALAASFFDRAAIVAEANSVATEARAEIIKFLYGENPEDNTMDVTISMSNLEDVDRQIDTWIAENRQMFIRITPIGPSNRASDSSTWQGAGVYSGGYGGPQATGGPVRGGFDYIVGENGPERFTAPADGYISKGTGDGGMVNVFVFNNRDAAAIGMAQAGVSRRLRMDRRMGVSR